MYNPYLIVPFLVWIITQFLKFILAAANGKLDFRYLYASGGMPSVHSAVVTSLAMTAFLVDGPASSQFGITAILAAIVMYDSFGVRRSSGEQATAINVILDSLQSDRIPLNHPQHRLRELLGHKPLEVTIGAAIGFTMACLFNFDRMDAFVSYMTSAIGIQMIYALGGLGVLFIVGGIVMRWLYVRKYKKVPVVVRAIKTGSWIAIVVGLLSALIAFLAYEKVVVASWLLWPILLALVALASFAWFYKRFHKVIPEELSNIAVEEDKAKWFEGPNKKRRAAKAKKRR